MKKPADKKKKKRSTRRHSREESGVQIAARDESPILPPEVEEKGKGETGKPPVQQIAARKAVEKKPEKRKDGKSSLGKAFSMAVQFLREAKMELKKVKWPTRKELLASTAMVIFLVLIAAIFLGVIDFGLIKIIKGVVG